MTPMLEDDYIDEKAMEKFDDENYNKALGQIRGYIESKRDKYGLTNADVMEILMTIVEDY